MATEKDQAFWDRFDVAWQAAWNEGKFDAMDEYYAPDYVYHQPPFPDVVGLEAYKKFIADARAASPGFHLTYEGSVHEGDWCVQWGRVSGTYTGTSPLAEVATAGTGQKNDYVWCSRVRWVGTKAVEEWVYRDHVSMLRQRGYTITPP